MPEVSETVLDNGLTVLVRESHAAPVASCWAGYRVGVRNERPGITGASHWVEHMTFKGTAQLGKGDIFRLTARHGGGNNGFTSDDFTCYYETLPSAQLELALLIESERMAHALFDPEETERERSVILAEREGAENHPHYQLAERMGEAVFQRHPYRWPVIGTLEDLERITPGELLAHYRSYYAPNNAVLAIAGDVDTGETLASVRRYFGALPPQPPPPPMDTVEPPQDGERRVEVRSPGAAPYLHAAYRAPAFGHPDFYPLVLLDAVLSGAKPLSSGGGGYMGRTARIYQAVVETRIATSGGSGYRFMMDPYAFSVSMTVREETPLEEAEEALVRVTEAVAVQPPTPEELGRVLRQAEAQFAYSRDGVTSQAYSLLFFQLLSHWSDLERHLERLREVTPEDVARVARAYLCPSNRTVGWFIPTPE
jgi:zinc protease